MFEATGNMPQRAVAALSVGGENLLLDIKET